MSADTSIGHLKTVAFHWRVAQCLQLAGLRFLVDQASSSSIGTHLAKTNASVVKPSRCISLWGAPALNRGPPTGRTPAENHLSSRKQIAQQSAPANSEHSLETPKR